MIKLYNTLSRRQEEFKPLKKGQVGIYSCGPTVYNYAHVGNLRAFLGADILRRTLEFNDYKVKLIMNITDVGHLTSDADTGEDKMEKGARREKKTVWDIAKFYTEAFKKDVAQLNIKPATEYPRATDHIKEQIALVKKLEKQGFAYKISDQGIYFDTSEFKDYGRLARLDISGLRVGARVARNYSKRNPTDFALWKFSPRNKKRQMEWDSPWGKGFPGWHIECSAMSTKYLGQPFDIHTGGIDHIPVHHVNEIAQSEAAYNKPLANYWLHSEFLVLEFEQKMAKSGGNFITLEKISKSGFDPLAFRYFVLTAHYRTKLNFSWRALETSQSALDSLRGAVLELGKKSIKINKEYKRRFQEALNNDLDTSRALAIMWLLLKDKKIKPAVKKATILKFDQVLGLDIAKIKKEKLEIPEVVQELVQRRETARQEKKWDLADQLRAEIFKEGFIVEDSPAGSQVKKKK